MREEIVEFTNEEILEDINLDGRINDVIGPTIERYPCNRIWASQMGYFIPQLEGCLRRGVYEQTHWHEKEIITPRLKMLFNDGNEHERLVLKLFSDLGIQIVNQQNAFVWEEFKISGKTDGAYIYKHHSFPAEIKGVSPYTFDAIRNYPDLMKHPWLRTYKTQITIYMLMKNINKGVLIFKNKATSQIKVLIIDLDWTLGDWIVKAAQEINKCVKSKELPEKINNREICKRCPFKLICLPDMDFGQPIEIKEDPMFYHRLNFHVNNKEFVSQYLKDDKIMKGEIKATMNKNDLKELKEFHTDIFLHAKRDSRGAVRCDIKRCSLPEAQDERE